MKTSKYYIVILMVVLSVLFSTQKASANEQKIVDEPNILNTTQEQSLNTSIQNIIKEYHFDLAIIIVSSTEGKTTSQFADDYFDYNDYGIGSNKDGALIVMDYTKRNIAISTHGSGLRIFTDYGINYILDELVTKLADNNYYSGFKSFVSLSKQCLQAAQTGTPYDINNPFPKPKNIVLGIGIGMVGGAIIAYIVLCNMKAKMKSIIPEKTAKEYIGKDGLVLLESQDILLYSTTTKTRIVETVSQTSSSRNGGKSSRGGTTTHKSSSGRVHGGGSRHF